MPTGAPASAAQERRVQRDVADAAAGDVEPREPRVVEPARRRLRREDAAPDRLALRRIRHGEVHDEAQAALEGAIERGLLVAREDRQAAVGLDALQQVAHLDVGVAVVAVPDLAALAEQRVGLVEEQDRAAVLGGVEEPGEVLLRFADVLAHDRGEIDAVELEMQLVREHLGRHRLAGAALAGEERRDAQSARALPGKPPPLEDGEPMAQMHRHLPQSERLRLGQHQVVPARGRVDALRERVETAPLEPAARLP